LLQVLQPHGDVEPIEDRRRGDAGSGQGQAQTRAPVGKAGQHRGPGSANVVERSADQRRDVRRRSSHGCEDLSAASVGLDVAKLDLQMPSTFVTAADEC